MTSNGSNENMVFLNTDFADLALTQLNVLLNQYYDESSGTKRLKVIAPLFKERLLIYVKDFQNISFDSLKHLISLPSTNKFILGVTSKNGYPYEAFELVSKFLELNLSKIELYEANYNRLEEMLLADSIHAMVSFTKGRPNNGSLVI